MTTESFRDRYEAEGQSVHRYDATEFWDRRYHVRRFEHIRRMLDEEIRPGDTLVDLGCGSGEYLTLANGQHLSVGVDLSEAYCLRARTKTAHVVTIVADGTNIPLADGSCDVLLCSEVIEHLPADLADDCLREILRVTSRTVVFSTPNDSALVRRLARAVAPARVAQLDADVGHINLLTRARFRELLQGTGWKVRRLVGRHIAPPVVGERPMSLSPRFARAVGSAERVGDAMFASAGNSMIAVLDRR